MAKSSIGKIIFDYRKKNKIGLREFSEKCGLSKSYIAKLEKEAREGFESVPSLKAVLGIATAMNMESGKLLKKIGLNISDAEQKVKTSLSNGADTAATGILPFEYIPMNIENLKSAISEGRVLILPYKAPQKGMRVYAPLIDCDLVCAYSITEVGGGVYRAEAEVGTLHFSLFDIGRTVYMTYGEAFEKLAAARVKGGNY